MAVGRASLLDVNGRDQVRTYHYPFTYTFYSLEHFLEHHGFELRLSDIADGRIIVHFDGDVTVTGGRRGFLDLTFEAREDATQVRMVSAFYTRINDPRLFVVRSKVLRRMQAWLDEERTMTLPTREGDIPRFRDFARGRLLMDRPKKLDPPDTSRLSGLLLGTGVLVSVTGALIVLGLDIWTLWATALVLLCGLPFILCSQLLDEGETETALSVMSIALPLAGLGYVILTTFVGVLFILIPVAMIDEELWEVRTWRCYFDEEERVPRVSRRRDDGPDPGLPRPGIMY